MISMVKALVCMKRSFATTFVMPYRLIGRFSCHSTKEKSISLIELRKLILEVQNKCVSTKQLRLFTEHLYLVVSHQTLVSLAKYFMKLLQNFLEGL